MGTTVSVASTVYNLAGPEEGRTHFLKSLIFGGVQQGADSLGEVVATGYRNGPAMRFRRFLNWTKRDPEFASKIGITKGEFFVQKPVDLAAVRAALPSLDPDAINEVDFAEISTAGVDWWAKAYLAEKYPERLVKTVWEADYDEETNEITITWETGGYPPETFTPVNFHLTDPNDPYAEPPKYLYVGFRPVKGELREPLEVGEWTEPVGGEFPSTIGMIQDYYNVQQITESLGPIFKQTITYSDGRPARITQGHGQDVAVYENIDGKFREIYYQGLVNTPDGEVASSTEMTREIKQTGRVEWTKASSIRREDIGGGVTMTVTTETEQGHLVVEKKIRHSYQQIRHNTFMPQRILIYKQGTNPPSHPMEQLFLAHGQVENIGEFYPPIPFRHKNRPFMDKPLEWNVELPAEFFTYDAFGIYTGIEAGDFVWVAEAIDKLEETDRHGEVKTLYRKARILTLNKTTRMAKLRHPGYGGGLSDGDPWRVPQDQWLYNVLEKAKAPAFSAMVEPNTWSPPGWTPTWIAVEQTPTPDPRSQAEVEVHDFLEKTFKKAFDAKYDDVMESINSNKGIKDIDYAYAVFGVSLNTKENACKKYIYEFFKALKRSSPVEEEAFFRQYRDAYLSRLDEIAWRNNNKPGGQYTQPPRKVPFPSVPWQEVVVYSRHTGLTNYRIKLKWAFISEDEGTGVYKTDAKPGDVWIEKLPKPIPELNHPLAPYIAYVGLDADLLNDRICIVRQVDLYKWERITVTGLHHQNYIYKNKKVEIRASKALDDTKESGFIIPLQESVYESLGIVDRTQMATACCFLVFNYYEKQDIPWYASGWFKVLLVVVIVAVAVVGAIATGGTSLGLLGTAATVGGSIGLSGPAAIVAGAIINSLAALAVGFIINEVSVAALGEKWGSIIGMIATTVLTLGAGTLHSSQNFFNSMTRVDNLIALTSAVSSGTGSYFQALSTELAEEAEAWQKNVQKLIDEVIEKTNEEFSDSEINPDAVSQYISELTERPDQFLNRTLMVGSDIIELSLELISDFATHTTRLELP